jgi:hypothetical protein
MMAESLGIDAESWCRVVCRFVKVCEELSVMYEKRSRTSD